jgi:AcrR family transcriptional regulator
MLREERIAREAESRRAAILGVARDLLGRDGISRFTMERVADEAGYARTAIYRFFSAKREILVELAIESVELRLELYRRVARWEARPRERIVACGEVTCLLYPRHVLPHVYGLSYSERAKKTDARLERLRALQREDDALTMTLAKEAVDAGDLELRFGLTLEETLFALHSLTQGILERVGSLPLPPGVDDPRVVLRRAGGRLLDGLGWRPLSSEWDYRATMRRIYDEVFPPRLLATLDLIGGAHREELPIRKRSA